MRVNNFTPVAQAYTDKVSPYRYPQFLALAHELNLTGNEHVLDIGCGAGVLSREIAGRLNKGGHVTGIDLSPSMIDLAQKATGASGRTNLTFQTGDALDLEFDSDQFDLAISSNAFPWVPNRQQFLAEALRVLKPGGQFGLVALSTECYREFAASIRQVATVHPDLFLTGKPFEIMGARLHSLTELSRLVEKAGFALGKRFVMTTREPISVASYIERVNAIVNENYLDHLGTNGSKGRARGLIYEQLASRNGELHVTEASAFVIARK